MSRPIITIAIANKALDVSGTAEEFLREFGALRGAKLAEALEELVGSVYEHGRSSPKPAKPPTARDAALAEIRHGVDAALEAAYAAGIRAAAQGT